MKEHLVVSVKTLELILDSLLQTKEGTAALALGQDLILLNRNKPVQTEENILREHQIEKLAKKKAKDGKSLDN